MLEIKFVWIEIFMNFILKMIDIEVCVYIVYKCGDIILVVDNIFMLLYFQCFLVLGVDICMCFVIKYMNGYSDVVMGLVFVNCERFYNRFCFL